MTERPTKSTQNNYTAAIYNEYSGLASYHKVNVKCGDNVGTMNEAVKEYAANQRIEEWIVGWIEGNAEGKIETIRNMLKDNIPLETV